ncbi:MAG TPA: RnfABCDGE type electron transport complex subunit G [Clostridiaceae bacterium]|nr:RnfABCDGE type electron transport complex subunit G [Clostridiaceae bacterium]
MRDMIKPSLVLFLVCLFVTAALAFTYNITKDKIAHADEESIRREVLAEADVFNLVDEAQIKSIIGDNADLEIVKAVYEGKKDDETVGYVYSVTNKGYGGDINLIIGINAAGTITGVKVVEHSETAGLGSKVAEEDFLSQFKGITPQSNLKIVLNKANGKDEEIVAVSGATISSKAVMAAVQSALNLHKELINQGGAS